MSYRGGRTYTERVTREKAQRELARLCPPHPRSQVHWTQGDYATPSERRCARCWRRVPDDREVSDG
jgi:hypothetical protein